MAIRNTSMGGTDWVSKELIKAEDLNDTFDVVFNKVNSLSTFWLNSDLYDVYDDFNSYSTGAFITASSSKWTVNSSEGMGAAISESTNAGGMTKELAVGGSMQSFSQSKTGAPEVIAEELLPNRHTYCRVRWVGSPASSGTVSCYAQVKLEGGSYQTYASAGVSGDSSSGNSYTDIFVLAKGSDTYDVYVGGYKIISNHTTSTFKLYINAVIQNNNGSGISSNHVYIDDVRQSKGSV